jgi:hypothetical protein
MNLHGVDVYVWSDGIPKVPDQVGKLSLTFISNRGTKVFPGPPPDIDFCDWPRCRYVSQEEIEDVEVARLLTELSEKGFRWTKAQKLFWKDGVKQYSEAY